jgi:hypothetical protein
MSLSTRSAIAAAVTAAVAFSITAPAASAAPHDKPAHVKVSKDRAAQAKPAIAKADQPGRQVRLQKLRTNLLRQAAVLRAAVTANELLVAGNLEAAAANDEAAVAVAAAAEKALALTGMDLKVALREVRADLRTARVALEAVAAAMTTAVEGQGPADQAPTENEPVS